MMNEKVLELDKDVIGVAIKEYLEKPNKNKIVVSSPDFDDDYISVSMLFRRYDDMPEIERKALDICKGRVLDVGAGAGCHSLYLKEKGLEVDAIDVSPLSVETMKKQGINTSYCVNFFDERFIGSYDTILMMMNGVGIIESVDNMNDFFSRVKSLLSPGGMVVFDSSDLKYLYDDGLIDISSNYYGEVEFQMSYKGIEGDKFRWLYIDADTFDFYANMYGLKVEVMYEGDNMHYLGVITYK